MFLEARQTSICWFLRILIVQEKTIAILERRFDKPWGGDNMDDAVWGDILSKVY